MFDVLNPSFYARVDERFGGPDQYFKLANVLALGYMKGLAQSIEKVYGIKEAC
jgi:hypothetical protein